MVDTKDRSLRKGKINTIYFVEITSKPPSEKGFIPLAKRWVSKRTFVWFNFFRRLSKDYEHSPRCAEFILLLANCAIFCYRTN